MNRNGIEFERNKKFPECRRIRPLSFDFYIPRINTLIEYDGRQHYLSPFFSEKMSKKKADGILLSQKESDKIKGKFARKVHINLVRIKYTKINQVEEILGKLLVNYERY